LSIEKDKEESEVVGVAPDPDLIVALQKLLSKTFKDRLKKGEFIVLVTHLKERLHFWIFPSTISFKAVEFALGSSLTHVQQIKKLREIEEEKKRVKGLREIYVM